MAITGDLAKSYLERFPETPTLTLAKKLYKENKEVFSSLDAARLRLRYYRGQNGEQNRSNLADDTFVVKAGTKSPFDNLPVGLTYFDEYKPYIIKGENILVIADTHIPYHSLEHLKIALQTGLDEDIDTILLMGDIVDFYSVSFWEKDPRKRNFQYEINQLNLVLSIIREAFPNVTIIYMVGNHEERFERYLKVKAPELINMEVLQFSRLINSNELRITVIGDKRIVKIGRLNCIHGHEFGRSISSPVNPARGLYLKGKEIAICAHFHQSSQHTEKSMTDSVISCWSLGCLCGLRPDYLPINKWNHGFAIIHKYSDKEFQVFNRRIINGKVY